MVLRSPSYLSLESALSRHGVLSQAPATYTLVTTDLPRTTEALDHTFEYHHIQPDFFAGFDRDGALDLAHPEKALLDLIYLRFMRTRTLSESRLESLIEDMDLELLRQRKLVRYAKLMRMGNWAERLRR